MPKYTFTQTQFDEIKRLLEKRLSQDKVSQKSTRAKIRKLGFMISDYHNNFTHIDFQELLNSGIIQISGSIKSNSNNLTRISIPKQEIPQKEIPKFSIEKSLDAFVDTNSSILILGTMPGEKSLSLQQYYSNPNNAFWKIVSKIFEKETSDYKSKTEILRQNNIALWDVLKNGERQGSLDSAIKNQFPNDFKLFFEKYPNIQTVIFNGQKSFDWFKPQLETLAMKKYYILPSTSSSNTHKTLNQKSDEWSQTIRNGL